MPGRLFFTAVFLLLSTLASAQVYKWTDEHGVIHYGDEPPDTAYQHFQFKGHSEIQMRDNIRAREAIARERKKASRQPPEQTTSREQRERLAREHEARRNAEKCQNYRDRIKRIDSQLRAGGYSVARGNRLRAERRELHGKLAWECLRG